VAGSQRRISSVFIISFARRLYSRLLLAAVLAVAVAFLSEPFSPRGAHADHLMCDWKVEQRTQTVWIDPDLTSSGVTHADVLAAFEPWNRLFSKYHGLPIFREHRGHPAEADIVIAGRGSQRTWVKTLCSPGAIQQGAAHSTVFLGPNDSWRNRAMLAHELGHTLGLADHGANAQHVEGHIGFRSCDYSYIGVMSYCSSPQSWFLDYEASGITFDGGLVRGYW
jgi:hypothetical protein